MAEVEWITLDRKDIDIIQMPFTMHVPIDTISKPFVALEAELSESELSLEVGLMAAIDVGPSFGNIYAVRVWSMFINRNAVVEANIRIHLFSAHDRWAEAIHWA